MVCVSLDLLRGKICLLMGAATPPNMISCRNLPRNLSKRTSEGERALGLRHRGELLPGTAMSGHISFGHVHRPSHGIWQGIFASDGNRCADITADCRRMYRASCRFHSCRPSATLVSDRDQGFWCDQTVPYWGSPLIRLGITRSEPKPQ